MDTYIIIPNTLYDKTAYINIQDTKGCLHGASELVLTESDIDALKNGKCIATSINDEYNLFITTKVGE